jgi:hypothetical protein
MAASVISTTIEVNGKQAEQAVGSIKTRLREARTELTNAIENFGEFSKEAVTAAQKVEGLKGTIDDASRLVSAFDGDRKFQAFGQSVSAVASGFTAAQGALGLFGSESKEVEEALLKVNSAMALSQGINGVLEGVKSFKDLRAVVMSYSIVQKAATVAQTIFNAVMAANPIGALVVAIAALIAGVVALTSYFMSNAKANRENTKAVEDNTKALKKQQEANKIANDELARGQAFQLAMAKANGASTKAIRALELKLIDEKIATEQLSRETANNTLIKNANALATLKQTGASDDLIEKQQQVVNESVKFANEQTANLRKSFIDREELQRKHTVEIATENTTSNTNAIAKRKENIQKANEAAEAANKKEIDDLKTKNQTALEIARINGEDVVKLRGQQIDAEIALIKSKGPKFAEAVKDLEREQVIAAATAAAEVTKISNQLRQDLVNSREQAIEADAAFFAEENEKERLAGEAAIQRERDRVQAGINLRAEDLAEKKRKAEEEKAIDAAVFDNKKKLLDATANALTAASDVVGRETAAGKSMAVAASLINTYSAIAGQLNAFKGVPIPGYAIVQAVATGLAGFAAVRNIIKTKVPGRASGAGGGVSVPTNITAPVAPQAESTRLDPTQVNQIGNAASRAYVVESDITGNQDKIKRLNRQARIN